MNASASSTPLDLLAFAPHPDDAEICCGGLLIKSASRGHRVGVVDFTRGELGSQGTPQERLAEAAAAGKIMGLAVRDNLGLPDGGLKSEEPQIRAVVKTIRAYQPKTLLIPYWHEKHPDHTECSLLSTKSVFLAGLRTFEPNLGAAFTVPQVIYYHMRYDFKPSFITDVSSVYDKKLQAIRCYESQIVRRPEAEPILAGQPGPLISSPRFMQSVEVRDRYYASMLGCDFAEPYLIKNALSISDPVRHFGEHQTLAAFAFPATL